MKVRIDLPFMALVISLLMQSAAALFGKQAALMIDEITLETVATNPFYLASLGCLVTQALAWQLALMKYPLTVAYFVMSLLPAIVLVASFYVFKEQISTGNILGCCIIVSGLVILSRGDGEGRRV